MKKIFIAVLLINITANTNPLVAPCKCDCSARAHNLNQFKPITKTACSLFS